MNNTEEHRDTIEKLRNALNKLNNEYKGDPEKTGIKSNKNGSYEVFVDNGPTFWFSNEIELGEWVLGVNYNDN